MTRRQTSPDGIALIERSERFMAQRYRCPAGKVSIGFGHVIRPYEKIPARISLEEARALLAEDLAPIEIYLTGVLPDLAQHEFDALASFIFNVGLGAFERSTLFGRLKAGDKMGAASQFARWVYANGQSLPGLVKRRAAERALFLGLTLTKEKP